MERGRGMGQAKEGMGRRGEWDKAEGTKERMGQREKRR